jgi:ferrochelatase
VTAGTRGAGRSAVLLCNLGTPDAPTADAVRRYLAEFLSDPRVVEIPRVLWLPLLHGLILRVRPSQSAAKYAKVWMDEGSPLAVWTARQATLLRGYLGQRGWPALVRHAMRYGNPSIASELDALVAEGAERILVLPLYPQYAASTTASVFDAVAAWAKTRRNLPELRFVKHWQDDPGYIAACARRVTEHWTVHGRPDRLVLSFHGLPKRAVDRGDPYFDECQTTAAALVERLKLPPGFAQVTFQSRFGRAEWLEPATEATLVGLAREGTKHVQVFCPGFASDCLETLEEIDLEAREAFLGAGGTTFETIPCLNDHHAFVDALARIAIAQMAGWPVEDGVRGPPPFPVRPSGAVAAGAA